jgi:hypothetical protein
VWHYALPMAMPTIQRQISASTAQDPQRELLQDRLALFGKVGALLALTYMVLFNIFRGAPQGLQALPTDPANITAMLLATVLASAWLITRGAPRSGQVLKALDVACTVAVCIVTSIYGWRSIGSANFGYDSLLVTSNVLAFRAALVPSTTRRTLLVGALGAAPTIGLALSPAALPVTGVSHMGYILGWSVVGVAISAVISGVIFGLQQRARRAERLGQYELLDRIGAGAMGEVFRARHAMLRRPTAVKLLKPHIAGPHNIARFEREVQHTAALTHPNTVAIYDYGRTPDGLFYYAMEFLDGTDLQRLVDGEGPQPPGRVLHILRQICGSLTEAHEAGLVHRDVKAANVFLCERGGVADVVKVLDFGLVLHADDARERALAGTPTYLAPECIQQPGTVSTLADIYAVGVLAYVLLTGRTPIGGSSVDEILANQVSLEPRPPSHHLRQDLPEELERIVMACLAKDPGDRPTSARKLGAMLAACTVEGDHRPAASAPAAAPDALMAAETIMPDEV